MKNIQWSLRSIEFLPGLASFRKENFPELLGDSQFYCAAQKPLKQTSLLRPTSAVCAEQVCIGVVGTRKPTAYGLRFLNQWLDQQMEFGFVGTLLSGGAMGIDAALHEGALSRGLKTQAFLVGPKLSPNPIKNHRLFERMATHEGCALWVPYSLEPTHGRSPQPPWWLYRNRWLSACCDALIVVEAGTYSGTWYTVKIAQKFGIPVFALPGPFDSPVSEGTNLMISRGYATPINSLSDLQKTLVVELPVSPYNGYVRDALRGKNMSPQGSSLQPEANGVLIRKLRLWLREPGGQSMNDLLARVSGAGFSVSDLCMELRRMQEAGMLSRLGDRFEGRG